MDGDLGDVVAALQAARAAQQLAALDVLVQEPRALGSEQDRDLAVPGRGREAPGLEYALSNSFGFGGTNACVAFAKFPR